MPTFLVIGHRVRTDGDFNLNDLSGSTGRLDILLRCINAAFMLSNDIRRDVELYLLLLGEPEPPKVLRFSGKELKHLNPDERSTASLVKRALEKKLGEREIRSTPGVFVRKAGLSDLLDTLEPRRIVYLRESGMGITQAVIGNDDVFVLGGQENLSPEEESILGASSEIIILSLGPRSLHAGHCVTIVLSELDRL